MKAMLLFLYCMTLPMISVASNTYDPDLEIALQSIEKVQNISTSNLTELNLMSKTWKKRCEKKSADQICFIEECDIHPKDCTPNHVLLFRGESSLYALSTTSALLRAKLRHSEYASQLTLTQLLNQFSEDIEILRTLDAAPQDSPMLLTVNEGGIRKWSWKSTGEPFKPYQSNTKLSTPAFTTYSFHVEASYLFFEDQTLNQQIAIDPLISMSSDPFVARSFSGEEPERYESKPEGRVIVLSVPKSDLQPLCGHHGQLTPGSVLDPRRCKTLLNEHTEEQELDVVLYVKPDWIYRSFITQ
jgi:hypothetical protein